MRKFLKAAKQNHWYPLLQKQNVHLDHITKSYFQDLKFKGEKEAKDNSKATLIELGIYIWGDREEIISAIKGYGKYIALIKRVEAARIGIFLYYYIYPALHVFFHLYFKSLGTGDVKYNISGPITNLHTGKGHVTTSNHGNHYGSGQLFNEQSNSKKGKNLFTYTCMFRSYILPPHWNLKIVITVIRLSQFTYFLARCGFRIVICFPIYFSWLWMEKVLDYWGLFKELWQRY